MKRTEVERLLIEIGTYDIRNDDFISYIGFDNIMTRFTFGYIMLLYDKNDNLIGASRHADLGLGDWVLGADCREYK
jgi:hypothetical protein